MRAFHEQRQVDECQRKNTWYLHDSFEIHLVWHDYDISSVNLDLVQMEYTERQQNQTPWRGWNAVRQRIVFINRWCLVSSKQARAW